MSENLEGTKSDICESDLRLGICVKYFLLFLQDESFQLIPKINHLTLDNLAELVFWSNNLLKMEA